MNRRALGKQVSWIVGAILFILSLALYVSRMAPSVVSGDPGEYQLAAARWGIGHPPGYGFYALVGNVFTHAFPVGTPAWRANLLAAVCGAAIVALAYGMGQTLDGAGTHPAASLRGQVPSLVGAATLAAGIDLWQHAIHANAHILTALLATISLFCLLCWWHLEQVRQDGRDRWLYFFCLVTGLSPVQHPLLVFAFPAYAVFIVVVRPRILMDWRTLLKMGGFALLGLCVYLYYPIRSVIGAPPAPGPDQMHTWAGFVNVVTAQGLRVNLLQFSVPEIVQRLWDVRIALGLQYSLPALALAGLGWVGLWARRWQPALLLTAYVACVVLVTVNILQDAMAYLLGPMVVIGLLLGLGVGVVVDWVDRYVRRRWAVLGTVCLLAILPLWSASVNWTRMDLSGYRDADQWLEKVRTQLGGSGEWVTLLTEWERMTTVYYYAEIEGQIQQEDGAWSWEEAGVRFVPIHAGKETPFLDEIDANLPRGAVYLTTYRPRVTARYHMMPRGDFWQVLATWPRELPPEARPVDVVAGDQFQIVGWHLSSESAQPGDVLHLDLYMRKSKPEGVDAQRYYLPWVKLGETTYRFTTDSRFNTPWWQPGEIVVERFDLPVAWGAQAGSHPLQVGVWLDGQEMTLNDGDTLVTLTEVAVEPAPWKPSERELDQALGNLHGEILLTRAWVNGQRVPIEERLRLRPGTKLRVALGWESLRPIDENYTVFVQLLDPGFQVRAQSDTTPLGGSAPTLLWFPRWRRGMRLIDTHVLHVPADLPPGQYPLVVGMYGFSTHKRVQVASSSGDVDGDWITLAHLWVE